MTVKKSEYLTINQSLGKQLNVWVFSFSQAVYGSLAFGSVFGLSLIANTPLSVSLPLASIACLSTAFILGSKPSKTLATIIPTPTWIEGLIHSTSATQRKKVKKSKVKLGSNKTRRGKVFASELELVTPAKVKTGNKYLDCYILASSNGDLAGMVVKFVYKFKGFSPLQPTSEQFTTIAANLEEYFKAIDLNATVTFRFASFCPDTSETTHNRAPSTELERLEEGDIKRNKGLIKAKVIRENQFYATITSHLDAGQQDKDWLDDILTPFNSLFNLNSKKNSRHYKRELSNLLYRVARAASRQQQLLKEAGLEPVNLSCKELVTYLAKPFGTQTVPLTNHILILDNQGLRLEFLDKSRKKFKAGQIHLSNHLVGEKVPVAGRDYVYLPNLKKYVAILVLEGKPAGYLNYQHQIQYWQNILTREDAFDCELILELSRANATLATIALERQTYNATSSQLEASKQNRVAVNSQVRQEQTLDARFELARGNTLLHAAVKLLVYRDTISQLDEASRYLQGLVRANLVRETQYTWLLWLQSTGLKRKPLLYFPFNRRLTFFASELAGMFNFTQVPALDKKGLELIAHPGGDRVYLDFDGEHKNTLIFGIKGSGKSLLAFRILQEVLCRGHPVVVIDYPNPDGSGTYQEVAKYLPQATYLDISSESINVVEPSHQSNITDPKLREERFEVFLGNVEILMTTLVLGEDVGLEGYVVKRIRDFLPLGLRRFYNDLDIQQRFAGKDNSTIPTLIDTLPFFSREFLQVEADDREGRQACNIIQSSIRSVLAKPIGRAIGRASTINTNSQLIVIALTNLRSEQDKEIMSLVALNLSLRLVLNHPKSLFYMDEASVNLDSKAIGKMIGDFFATKRKAGCQVMLAAQEVDSIAKSSGSSKIFGNWDLLMIGRVAPGSEEQYTRYFDIPPQIISQNQNFKTSKKDAYSEWLIYNHKNYSQCRFYPSFVLLALTINNPDEKRLREEFKHRFGKDWVEEYANYLEQQSH